MNYSDTKLIKIKNFEDIRKFANTITTFESDVNIYYNDNKYYDAKSILAVIVLDISQPRYIKIISNNEEEIKRFNECMSEFEYKE